jgi:DNA (cytosine-5)-methyltransferase 1
LGYAKHDGLPSSEITGSNEKTVLDSSEGKIEAFKFERASPPRVLPRVSFLGHSQPQEKSWWGVEPSVGRVVDEFPSRVDRIKRLGNAVVPLQAKAAFEILMGLI